MTELDDILDNPLLHDGVKGMKWGVVRWRKTKAVSDKPKSGEGRIKQEWNSLKRERHWKATLKNIDSLSTKHIGTVTRRVGLENELKKLSKSGMATGKDKKDYRLREKMSDQELNRKVGRLRAKNALSSQVNTASKEQRAIGKKIVETGGSIALKYALNKKLSVGDVYESVSNPKAAQTQAVKSLLDMAVKNITSK